MKNSSLLTYSTSVTYTYDSDGIRGTKKVNGIKSTYHYVGGQLRYEERGNTAFYYFYDASGNLSAIRYVDSSSNIYQYYALTNAQGDVIAFYNAAGNCVVTYEYDAWGNCKITKDTNGIGELNPIRYRGYYYDTETGLYYLQSRYYDPQIGRFISSDDRLNTENLVGFNMFSYCENNPVIYLDYTGHAKGSVKEWFLGLINDVCEAITNCFIKDYDYKNDTDYETKMNTADSVMGVVSISATGKEAYEDIYTHGKNIAGCIKDPNYKVEELNTKMDWEYDDYSAHCHKIANGMKDIYLEMSIDCYSDIDYNSAVLIYTNDSIFRDKWIDVYPNEMIDEGKNACGYPF